MHRPRGKSNHIRQRTFLDRLHRHVGRGIRDMRQGGNLFSQNPAIVFHVLRADLEEIVEIAGNQMRLLDLWDLAHRGLEFGQCRLARFVQAHLIAGNFDYLLKIRTQDMKDYRRVLAEQISTLPHVSNTSTYVAMEAVKESALSDVI